MDCCDQMFVPCGGRFVPVKESMGLGLAFFAGFLGLFMKSQDMDYYGGTYT